MKLILTLLMLMTFSPLSYAVPKICDVRVQFTFTPKDKTKFTIEDFADAQAAAIASTRFLIRMTMGIDTEVKVNEQLKVASGTYKDFYWSRTTFFWRNEEVKKLCKLHKENYWHKDMSCEDAIKDSMMSLMNLTELSIVDDKNYTFNIGTPTSMRVIKDQLVYCFPRK